MLEGDGQIFLAELRDGMEEQASKSGAAQNAREREKKAAREGRDGGLASVDLKDLRVFFT